MLKIPTERLPSIIMKSKRSTITFTSVNEFQWKQLQKNKKSNAESPLDGKHSEELVPFSRTKNPNLPQTSGLQPIIPTVTYGSETWNLTKIQTMKLRSMQRAHERIMLNITWRDHKTAEWIREQTKLRDILETISKAKWTWAGHLTRRTDNRWTTKLTFWQPRGHTRNKGRPKFRWRDDLDKFRKHWHSDASDRLRWRQMGKAYVQLRTFKG